MWKRCSHVFSPEEEDSSYRTHSAMKAVGDGVSLHSLQEGFHIRVEEWKIPTLVQLEPHSWWDNFSTSLWDHRNSCGAQMKKSVWVHRCARWRACCPLERQKEFSQVPSITNEVGGGGRGRSQIHLFNLKFPLVLLFLVLFWPQAHKKESLNCQDTSSSTKSLCLWGK